MQVTDTKNKFVNNKLLITEIYLDLRFTLMLNHDNNIDAKVRILLSINQEKTEEKLIVRLPISLSNFKDCNEYI